MVKEIEFHGLEKGDRVWHKHFGPCMVVDHVVWSGGGATRSGSATAMFLR
jgi:hypothetical protein